MRAGCSSNAHLLLGWWCELSSPQATDVGINRNEPQPQNSPNKFGPQTFFRSLAPDCHASTTRSSAPYKATLHAILRHKARFKVANRALLFRRNYFRNSPGYFNAISAASVANHNVQPRQRVRPYHALQLSESAAECSTVCPHAAVETSARSVGI